MSERGRIKKKRINGMRRRRCGHEEEEVASRAIINRFTGAKASSASSRYRELGFFYVMFLCPCSFFSACSSLVARYFLSHLKEPFSLFADFFGYVLASAFVYFVYFFLFFFYEQGYCGSVAPTMRL